MEIAFVESDFVEGYFMKSVVAMEIFLLCFSLSTELFGYFAGH